MTPLAGAALKFLEKQILRGLGKGYGTRSIAAELNAIIRLLNGTADIRLCVDVGGNVGEYTAALLRSCPQARIHTFEPAATNIARLKERFADETRVSIWPQALSDTAGRATLHSDAPGSGLASLSQRNLDHFNLDFDITEEVETTRFEDFWQDRLDRARIDILKLDIEGHELAALHGAGAAIDHCRAIQFEFGGCNIDTRTFFRDFWTFFSERGFALYRITPFGILDIPRYSERDEIFTTTNYIALNRNPQFHPA